MTEGTAPAKSSSPLPWRHAFVTLALAAAIVSPLARARGWDSFPISSYPMFSRGDLGSVNALAHVVLVNPDGTRRSAPPVLAGSPEPMIAMSIIRAHVDRGTSHDLCTAVATRARDTGAVAVEVVTSVFDSRRYFSGAPDARAPLERTVAARCEIPR